MEEDVLEIRIARLEKEIKSLGYSISSNKDTLNRLELEETRSSGDVKLELSRLQNSINNVEKDMIIKIKSAIEPIANNISIIQTKSATVGSFIGVMISLGLLIVGVVLKSLIT